jgi:uncharacterized OB-fold protein
MTATGRGNQARDWTSGAAQLLTSACLDCKHRWYIARDRCPRCASARIDRVPSAPEGLVAAVTSVSPRIAVDGIGLSLALVDLDDGIRIMARCPAELVAGARVSWFVPESQPDSERQDFSVPHLKVVEA